MTITNQISDLQELDAREADGLSVRLLWRPGASDVVVELLDSRLEDRLLLEVPGPRALDAFWHPFAYAGHAAYGIAVSAGVRVADA
jgi:hypothetical protein